MPQTQDSIISIITPCYNGCSFITSTYESVKSQSYECWEWIVVDDCSTDGSFELLSDISKKDDRVKVYRLDSNKGSAAARNYGLDKCTGKYTTFLDIDDLLDSDYLLEQKKILDEKGGVVVSGYRVIYDYGKETTYYPLRLSTINRC